MQFPTSFKNDIFQVTDQNFEEKNENRIFLAVLGDEVMRRRRARVVLVSY